MEKKEYLTPEMEVVEFEVTNHILAISNDDPKWGGEDPDENDPD